MRWTYIPAQAGLTVPEQWQARAGRPPRTVATLMGGCSDGHAYRWKATMADPQGAPTTIDRTCSLDELQSEVEQALRQMGWEI